MVVGVEMEQDEERQLIFHVTGSILPKTILRLSMFCTCKRDEWSNDLGSNIISADMCMENMTIISKKISIRL